MAIGAAIASAAIPILIKTVTNTYGPCLKSKTPGRCMIDARLSSQPSYRILVKKEKPAEAVLNSLDVTLNNMGLEDTDFTGITKQIEKRANKIIKGE